MIPGGSAIAPEFSVADGKHFVGWDNSYQNVMSDLTVTAQYVDKSMVSIRA